MWRSEQHEWMRRKASRRIIVEAVGGAPRATILMAEGDTAGAALQALAAYQKMLTDCGPTNPRTIRHAVVCARIFAASKDLSGRRGWSISRRPSTWAAPASGIRDFFVGDDPRE